MKLIFLYGAPGTGKLTVARELAALTGYRLFHNHLTVDLAKAIFDFGTPDYLEYVRFLRADALARAAKNNVDLIFTFWYSTDSTSSVRRYQEAIEQNGGEVAFVKLFCSPEILEQRVLSPERKNWKISSLSGLQAALENTDLEAVILGTKIVLDTSAFEPTEAATEIVKRLSF
ncbi:MAG: hypothetical protein RLZZ156_2515 [Deinococcota bacterium]|jgi:tRNA uridine 5-carbamoylmethylation protein Kti12